jgi:hypothetical protein
MNLEYHLNVSNTISVVIIKKIYRLNTVCDDTYCAVTLRRQRLPSHRGDLGSVPGDYI